MHKEGTAPHRYFQFQSARARARLERDSRARGNAEVDGRGCLEISMFSVRAQNKLSVQDGLGETAGTRTNPLCHLCVETREARSSAALSRLSQYCHPFG